MTFGEMRKLTKRFNQIVKGSNRSKNKCLEIMMNDLEVAYPDKDPYAVAMYMAATEELTY